MRCEVTVCACSRSAASRLASLRDTPQRMHPPRVFGREQERGSDGAFIALSYMVSFWSATPTMKIVVLDGHTLNPGDNPWDSLEKFGELSLFDRSTVGETVLRARDAEIIVTNKATLFADTLAQLPKLRFVAVTATGYNVVDLAETKKRGVPVSNVPEYSTNSVAQFTIGLILELVHRIGEHSLAVRSGAWSAQPHFSFWNTSQVELLRKTMVIIGYGRIGRRVGEIATALGMKILPVGREANLHEVIPRADVVTLHCPLTAENAGFVNRDFLTRMRPEAFFINAARGGLVVEQDLADALNAAELAGAAVDVVSVEPIRPDNPLLQAQNCIITPHIAWATLSARRRLMQTTAENIAAFIQGTPINVVNR